MADGLPRALRLTMPGSGSHGSALIAYPPAIASSVCPCVLGTSSPDRRLFIAPSLLPSAGRCR
jgi:hypothetical protein